jgi:phosphoribosylcarboxyaminoimidazole (NCAIR) mutase
MGLVAIAWPSSEPESAAMVSLLQANEIPCFVHGGNFASILPGLQIAAYNNPTIMVPESAAAGAAELLSVFSVPTSTATAPQTVGFMAKLRMVLEVLLFGRFVHHPRSASDDPPRDVT